MLPLSCLRLPMDAAMPLLLLLRRFERAAHTPITLFSLPMI